MTIPNIGSLDPGTYVEVVWVDTVFFGGDDGVSGDFYCEVCQAIVVKIWHDLNYQHVSSVCVCVGGGGGW